MFKNDYILVLLQAIEEQLRNTIESHIHADYGDLKAILQYHMGWKGEGAGLAAQGKRIRPLMLLLTAIAAGNSWERFLPFAASVELIHNFSLIHDDIEDNSVLRRGRKTLWALWGVPQAINAGDLMFTIAHLEILAKSNDFNSQILLEASSLVHQTCAQLTQGQFLDMLFETNDDITINSYWSMIGGKTAALIGCCTELGAILGDDAQRTRFRQFGKNLGLAFQVQDDFLGIWGDSLHTGKSSESDLVNRKKTLPILFALENNSGFKTRWLKGKITPEEAIELAGLLKEDGTQSYTKNLVKELTEQALVYLRSTGIKNDALSTLEDISLQLIERIN